MRAEESRQDIQDIGELAVAGEIKTFIELFKRGLPNAKVTVDPPAHQLGDWWLDISVEAVSESVVWRKAFGFGLFRAPRSYGDLPDEIVRTPEEACGELLKRTNRLLFKYRAQNLAGE